MTPPAHVLLAVAAGLALADASVVTLALPQLLPRAGHDGRGRRRRPRRLHRGAGRRAAPVERAAALSARACRRRRLALFALASAACAGAGDLAGLLVARCVQALGGAAGLATVFELLGGAGPGRRLWLGAAVFATALGPAVGGALTEAFNWRAIFFFQVPVAAAGAIAVRFGPRTRRRGRRPSAPSASRAARRSRSRSSRRRWRRCSSCSCCCSSRAGTSAR